VQEVSIEQLGMTRGRKPKPPKTERASVSFYLSIKQIARLDGLIERGLFLSRSEAMREALRDLISFYNHPEGSKKASVVEGREP